MLLWTLLITLGVVVLLVLWPWMRRLLRHRHYPRSRPLPPIAPAFLAAQARIGRLKHQDDNARAAADTRLTDRQRATRASIRRAPWHRTLLDALRHGGGAVVARLGWPGTLIALLVVSGTLGGLIWQAQRHPPVPPGAQAVQETIIEGFARQTAYRVPRDAAAVRTFYREALAQRGWHYCGTQATPRCSNLLATAAAPEIDVYRRVEDTAMTGLTIEIWPQSAPDEQTCVTVFVTRLRR